MAVRDELTRKMVMMGQSNAARFDQRVITALNDDPYVPGLVPHVLFHDDYTILTPAIGAAAFRQASGVDLATRMSLDLPRLKVLRTSSFPDGKPVRNEGRHFLAKPQFRALVAGPISPDSEPRRVAPSRGAGGRDIKPIENKK
jgi:hypothetical protein